MGIWRSGQMILPIKIMRYCNLINHHFAMINIACICFQKLHHLLLPSSTSYQLLSSMRPQIHPKNHLLWWCENSTTKFGRMSSPHCLANSHGLRMGQQPGPFPPPLEFTLEKPRYWLCIDPCPNQKCVGIKVLMFIETNLTNNNYIWMIVVLCLVGQNPPPQLPTPMYTSLASECNMQCTITNAWNIDMQ